MLIEIGLGWTTLAQIHLFSHALLRSYQFLKVPSALHTHHEIMSLYGENFTTPRAFLDRYLPERMRYWLYCVALERGFLETILHRIFVHPFLQLSRWLNQAEENWLNALTDEPKQPTQLPLSKEDPSLNAQKNEILVAANANNVRNAP
jgi:hypothetical protein